MSAIVRRRMALSCFLVWFSASIQVLAQQQVIDETFRVSLDKPAYTRGPTVAIDEAHDNFHTAGGQYKPFADLLNADGYRVIGSVRKFDTGTLAGVDVLVIANARNPAALLAGDLSKPAFTEHECDVVGE